MAYTAVHWGQAIPQTPLDILSRSAGQLAIDLSTQLISQFKSAMTQASCKKCVYSCFFHIINSPCRKRLTNSWRKMLAAKRKKRLGGFIMIYTRKVIQIKRHVFIVFCCVPTCLINPIIVFQVFETHPQQPWRSSCSPPAIAACPPGAWWSGSTTRCSCRCLEWWWGRGWGWWRGCGCCSGPGWHPQWFCAHNRAGQRGCWPRWSWWW